MKTSSSSGIMATSTPVVQSRNEINLRRLLSRCEAMIAEKISWRLKAYMRKVDELLSSLEKQNTCQPSFDTISEFRKKINYIRGAMVVDRAEPNEMLSAHAKIGKYPEKAEVQLVQEAKVGKQIRESLFKKEKPAFKEPQDVDAMLREQDSMQQKIAESMVSLAQDLKRNALTAKQLIVSDTEVVKRNLTTTENNYGNLQKESERLEKKLSFSCHCTMWFMLVLVVFVFLQMVVFIRFFPKKYY